MNSIEQPPKPSENNKEEINQDKEELDMLLDIKKKIDDQKAKRIKEREDIKKERLKGAVRVGDKVVIKGEKWNIGEKKGNLISLSQEKDGGIVQTTIDEKELESLPEVEASLGPEELNKEKLPDSDVNIIEKKNIEEEQDRIMKEWEDNFKKDQVGEKDEDSDILSKEPDNVFAKQEQSDKKQEEDLIIEINDLHQKKEKDESKAKEPEQDKKELRQEEKEKELFEDMTYRELQKIAKEKGLKASGKKEDLIDRLNKDKEKAEEEFKIILEEKDIKEDEPEITLNDKEKIKISKEDLDSGIPEGFEDFEDNGYLGDPEQQERMKELSKKLNNKRKLFIEADKKCKEGMKKRKGKEKITIIPGGNELIEAKKEYDKALSEYALLTKEIHESHLEIDKDNPDDEKIMEMIKASIFQDVIIKEHDILAKEKIKGFESQKKNWFIKLMSNYARLPLWKKALISTGVAVGFTAFGGAAGGVGAALIFGSSKFARGMIAGKAGAFTYSLIKMIGAKRIEDYNKKELDKLNQRFNLDIESEKDDFDKSFLEINDSYKELVQKINKKHRHLGLWATGASLAVAGSVGIGSSQLDGPFSEMINQKLGLTAMAAEIPSGDELPSTDPDISSPSPEVDLMSKMRVEAESGLETDIPSEAEIVGPPLPDGLEKPPLPSEEFVGPPLPTESTPVILEIGNRGPEGAIIDYFKGNPDIAKSFGWDGEGDLTRWAGIKAHQLWLTEANEALKSPEILKQLEDLGYSQDIKGFGEMMHCIGEGTIKINPTDGSIDLENMSYLEQLSPSDSEIEISSDKLELNKADVVEADALSSVEEIIKPTIDIPEGRIEIPYDKGDLYVTKEGSVVSFFLDDNKFAEGVIKEDGTYYIPHASIDPDQVQTYNFTRDYLEGLGEKPEISAIADSNLSPEALLEQDRMLINGIVRDMGARGFNKDEYGVIANLKVGDFLGKIPEGRIDYEQLYQDLKELEVKGGKLIYWGNYDYSEFMNQIKLAEFLRGLNLNDIMKKMTITEILREVG